MVCVRALGGERVTPCQADCMTRLRDKEPPAKGALAKQQRGAHITVPAVQSARTHTPYGVPSISAVMS